jgi:hypothetical protein
MGEGVGGGVHMGWWGGALFEVSEALWCRFFYWGLKGVFDGSYS